MPARAKKIATTATIMNRRRPCRGNGRPIAANSYITSRNSVPAAEVLVRRPNVSPIPTRPSPMAVRCANSPALGMDNVMKESPDPGQGIGLHPPLDDVRQGVDPALASMYIQCETYEGSAWCGRTDKARIIEIFVQRHVDFAGLLAQESESLIFFVKQVVYPGK